MTSFPALSQRHTSAVNRTPQKSVLCVLLVLLAVAAYAPVRHFGFIPFDDPANVSAEPHARAGLTLDGLRWAATSCQMGHWVPLTRLSYLMDGQWCRLDAGIMHVENVALHAAAGVLLFLFLADATGQVGRSGVVAALFVVHPMHVESVAWITERRDVLSTPLLFAAFWSYVRYGRADRGARRMTCYAAALFLYGASLLAKAMGMTAPALLLLLDFWPLQRIPPIADRRGRRWILIEKIPFAILALVAAVMGMHAQQVTGAASSLTAEPVSARVANALVTTVEYIRKLGVPTRLFPAYVVPADGWSPARVVAAAGVLAVAAVVAWHWRRRRPSIAMGIGWFAISLLPVSGLTQAGFQSMADRYSYLPSVGLGVALVWTVAEVARPARSRASAIVAAAVVVVLTVLCRLQVNYWKDARTLFEHAAAVSVDNWFADYQLGLDDARNGNYPAAAAHFSRTLEVNSSFADAYDDLGNCVFQVDPQRAIPFYQAAIQRKPNDARSYANLGNAYFALGRDAEAAAAFGQSLRLNPTFDYARDRLAEANRRAPTHP